MTSRMITRAVVGFARAYDAQLRKTPLPVKMATSGVIVGAADTSMQLATALDPSDRWGCYSLRRTLFVGVGYGMLWFAPVLHAITTVWARVLPSQTLPSLALKTTVDMTTAFPVNVCASISVLALARREPDVAASVRVNAWPTVLDGWKFWPAMTMLMYGAVPLRYRVAFINVGSFFWNSWLIFRFEQHSTVPAMPTGDCAVANAAVAGSGDEEAGEVSKCEYTAHGERDG